MKKRFLNGLALAFFTVFMSCGVCFANLLSFLHSENAAHNSHSRITVRFMDASKLIGELFPSKLLEAMEPLAPAFGFERLFKIADVLKALAKSNLREVAALIVLDDDLDFYYGGVILSVPGGEKVLYDAVESGKLTLFDLLSSFGEPVIEVVSAFGIPFREYEFERDSDGIFSYKDNYVYIEEDKIIAFETREGTLSVAKAVKSGVETKMTRLDDPNVFLVNIVKKTSQTLEDIWAETGITYEDSTWKIKTLTNAFKMLPIGIISPEELKSVQRILETVPMVGKGDPFLSSGSTTFIGRMEKIEEQLMIAGDMTLTLNWAMFLQAAQQIGISKNDLDNLLAGSAVFIFGLNSNVLGIPLPLGGYFAITAKDGTAGRVIGVIYESLAQKGVTEESKVDGWDKVYYTSFEQSMPGFLIAQRGETILFGIINPDDLKSELNVREIGIPEGKILNWLVLSTEKIWKSARNAYSPLSAMAMSGMFGNIADDEKEIIRFTEQLLKADFPMDAIKLWMSSSEEIGLNIQMNPSPGGDFWKVFFEWLIMVIDNAGRNEK